MNKKIFIGVILSCFLLIITPCINAIEYNEVKDTYHEYIEKEIDLLSNILKLLKTYTIRPFLTIFKIIYIIVYIGIFICNLQLNYDIWDDWDALSGRIILFLIAHALWCSFLSFFCIFFYPLFGIFLFLTYEGIPF